MLTSESADDLLDRVGMLRTIAEHNDGVLADADEATDDADRAQAATERAAADAQAQVDRLSPPSRTTLDAQIATYQAEYERLSEAEQRASRAAAERHAAEQAAAQAAAEAAGPADPGPDASDAARRPRPRVPAPAAPAPARPRSPAAVPRPRSR